MDGLTCLILAGVSCGPLWTELLENRNDITLYNESPLGSSIVKRWVLSKDLVNANGGSGLRSQEHGFGTPKT